MCAPSIPKAPRIAPPPTPQSPEVVAARSQQRKRQALAAGRQGTILTGPLGTTGSAPTSVPTLLGQ